MVGLSLQFEYTVTINIFTCRLGSVGNNKKLKMHKIDNLKLAGNVLFSSNCI